MFESIESFAESAEAFPLGTRMTMGKRENLQIPLTNSICSVVIYHQYILPVYQEAPMERTETQKKILEAGKKEFL